MTTTGSSLNQAVQILELRRDGDAYTWEKARQTWAAAEQDTRSNLFSAVGVGARGVTFTVRRNRALTLHNAFLWRGRHCFLTAILDGEPGFQVVKAALAEPETVHLLPDGGGKLTFPGILTEKYLAHRQEWPMSVNELVLVLVVPKAVVLHPGRLVECRGAAWEILVPHELDEFKNEYEIGRRAEL